MTTQQFIAYNQLKKSKGVAYVLFLFLGATGIHRVYLRSYGVAFLYLVLLLSHIFLPIMFIFTLLLCIVDLFYTSSLCDDFNYKLQREILNTK